MKYFLWIIGVLSVVGLLVVAVTYRPINEAADSTATTETATDGEPTVAPDVTNLSIGRYQTYNAGLVDDTGYSTTVLFFYASWCPECRGYDQAITAGSIPDGVQILKLDYDDSQDLRQRYGVTIQSTFVRVDARGDRQVLWNGYGRDKSLDTILENTK